MVNLSRETEALAQRLALAQGVPVEEAIRSALEDKIRVADFAARAGRPRDTSPEAVAARRERTNRFVARLAAMPILDDRPLNEIVDDLNAL